MQGVGWIAAIIIGIFAGWVAEKVLRRNDGLLMNLAAGIIGALLGKWLIVDLIGWNMGGGWIPSIIAAIVGAIIVLFIWGLIFRRRA
jgi:uncharacterized membrane protein YeaQ/YmgE (transglycosylase-associated protein family)